MIKDVVDLLFLNILRSLHHVSVSPFHSLFENGEAIKVLSKNGQGVTWGFDYLTTSF